MCENDTKFNTRSSSWTLVQQVERAIRLQGSNINKNDDLDIETETKSVEVEPLVECTPECGVSETPPPAEFITHHRLTFEEHFQKPEIQRVYQLKLFKFEIGMRLSLLVISLLCSIFTYSAFYRQNFDTARTILVISTTIFSVAATVLPYVFSKMRKLRKYPWLIIEVVACGAKNIVYCALFTFWTDLIFFNVWIGPLKASADDMPFLYTIPLSCVMSLFFTAIPSLCFIYGKMKLTKWQITTLTHFLIGVFMIVSISSIFRFVSQRPKVWDFSQILLASLIIEIEHLGSLFAQSKLVHGGEKMSSSSNEFRKDSASSDGRPSRKEDVENAGS